ncbi:MAG: NAD-dependent protein deacetylase [Pseudomonadota bacterium]
MADAAIATASNLAQRLADGARFAVLTGAGCSTGSGIPDYRDDDGEWKHARPVMFQDFVNEHNVRQRYWARSMLGWPRMTQAKPGKAHQALATLQTGGAVERLITQNVDGLHQQAGSADVIDLHGRLDEVRCLSCQTVTTRKAWQGRISVLNPQWQDTVHDVRDAPDGDAIIEQADYSSFHVPECPQCGGIVKPEVVFFGENVPRQRVDDAYAAVDAADGVIVAGSSLMVFSGFRFARRCHEQDKPLYIVNRGKTRADDIASEKLHGDVGEILQALADSVAPLK